MDVRTKSTPKQGATYETSAYDYCALAHRLCFG